MANTAREIQILQGVGRKIASQTNVLLGDAVTTRTTTVWQTDLVIDPVTLVNAPATITVVEDYILANIYPGPHTTP